MIRAFLCLLIVAFAAPAGAQQGRPAAAFHQNERAAYRIQIPAGWEAVANDEVDFQMREPRADLALFVRVLEGPYGDDRDAFRVLTDFYKDNLDYILVRAGAKPLPLLQRDGWAFVVRQTAAPRIEMVAIIPQTPNGESSIYYHLRLVAAVRRLDAIESEMDRLIAGFRIIGAPAAQPVRPRADAPAFTPPRENVAASAAVGPEALSERLEEWRLGYALRYPRGWQVVRLNDFTVRLSAGRDAGNRESAITIQNMAGVASGGVYERAEDVAKAFRQQILGLDGKAQFHAERPFVYARTRLRLKGTEFSAAYRVQGNDWRQWQIVLPRPDGGSFHAWGLTAPAERFDDYAKVAAAILESWVIAP
ncbi:MAG: hypothetical protein IT561_23700 [Alphaproteobacteria bacterium]|nr:hypothetical protein [Alphaproteobacteria bacterium]